MKKAFTLAEILITLGVIGVVAAMTIPNLIAAYQKKVTVTRLKASYSKMQQAFKSAEDEYGPIEEYKLSAHDSASYPNYELLMNSLIKERILPYVKVITDCGLHCPQRNKLNIYRLNGELNNNTGLDYYYTVYLSDGSSWSFMIDNDGYHYTYVKAYIDINGDDAPNTFGRDIFTVSFADGQGLYGSQSKFKRENLLGNCRECCSKTAVGNYAGDMCGGLIQRDGWVISKDYPWK